MRISKLKKEKLSGHNLKIAIIFSEFNSEIGSILLKNTEKSLINLGVTKKDLTIVSVPGALETPLIAKILAENRKYDAIITLGIILEGETAHFDIVSTQSYQGLMQVALETKVPIIFGILTCKTIKQAQDRAAENKLNKGLEFAQTAIKMAKLQKKYRKG